MQSVAEAMAAELEVVTSSPVRTLRTDADGVTAVSDRRTVRAL